MTDNSQVLKEKGSTEEIEVQLDSFEKFCWMLFRVIQLDMCSIEWNDHVVIEENSPDFIRAYPTMTQQVGYHSPTTYNVEWAKPGQKKGEIVSPFDFVARMKAIRAHVYGGNKINVFTRIGTCDLIEKKNFSIGGPLHFLSLLGKYQVSKSVFPCAVVEISASDAALFTAWFSEKWFEKAEIPILDSIMAKDKSNGGWMERLRINADRWARYMFMRYYDSW